MHLRSVAGLALAMTPTLALSQIHEGDIVLANIEDRIVTGAVDQGDAVFPVRVFGAAFGEQPNFTDDPGFDTADGAFPPFSTIGFNILRALREWDGEDFDAIPDERISIRFGPLGPVLTPETDTLVEGFGIQVNAGGEFHHHLGYTLLSPADTGVYLLELELWSDRNNIATSEAFWLVFSQNADPQDHADAIQWVIDNLAGGACVADLDGNGSIDADDFFLYLDLFAGGDARADLDGSGSIDADDFFMYLDLFAAGC